MPDEPGSDLQVIATTYDLVLWTCRHLARFPRSFRFTLGDRLERRLYDILDQLLRPVRVTVAVAGHRLVVGRGEVFAVVAVPVPVAVAVAVAAATVTVWLEVADAPLASLAVTVTTNEPDDAYVFVAGLTGAVLPSPKFQLKLYGADPPLADAVNVTACPTSGDDGL